jgi:hypothetical protein
LWLNLTTEGTKRKTVFIAVDEYSKVTYFVTEKQPNLKNLPCSNLLAQRYYRGISAMIPQKQKLPLLA